MRERERVTYQVTAVIELANDTEVDTTMYYVPASISMKSTRWDVK